MSHVPASVSNEFAKRKGMFDGFKEFIARGNAIELAVGVVIGGAFTAVVTALVDGIINPLIAGLFGHPNLDRIWVISLGDAEILPGMVLTALINFLLVAAAIYFFVVVPLNKLAERRSAGAEDAVAEPAADVALLTEIRDLLKAQSGR